MSIPLKDLKILWGRAAGHCSICNLKLSEDKTFANAAFPLGEQAHIVAEEKNGPRGESVLSATERNTYPNLILVCPNCHTRIDKNPQDFPIERLHFFKTEHELKIQRQFTRVTDDAQTLVNSFYANWVDKTVECCALENWDYWFSCAASTDPSWTHARVGCLDEFQREVVAAVWPGKNDELERAIYTLSLAYNKVFRIYFQHAVSDGSSDGCYSAVRFYRNATKGPEQYDQLLGEFENWLDLYYLALGDLAKAANWFASVVRRDLNPTFFLEKGRFINSVQFHKDMSPDDFKRIHEFTAAEKAVYPGKFLNSRMID